MTKYERQNGENNEIIIDQITAAAIAGVTDATMIRWNTQENPPPRRGRGYPAKEFGEWIRMHQIRKPSRGKHGSGQYPYAPPGWGPLIDATKFSPDSGSGDNKTEVEIRLKTAQAEKIEMENAVTAGTLVVVSEVADVWGKILSRVRTRILKLPTTLAPLVFGDPNVYSIQEKLKDAVSDALSELSNDWRNSDADEEGDDE